jgi:hypothetical protein
LFFDFGYHTVLEHKLAYHSLIGVEVGLPATAEQCIEESLQGFFKCFHMGDGFWAKQHNFVDTITWEGACIMEVGEEFLGVLGRNLGECKECLVLSLKHEINKLLISCLIHGWFFKSTRLLQVSYIVSFSMS